MGTRNRQRSARAIARLRSAIGLVAAVGSVATVASLGPLGSVAIAQDSTRAHADGRTLTSRAKSTGAIAGVVRSHAGSPVAFAEIVVSPSIVGATSDDSGAFHLAGAPAGTDTVVVRRVGYAPVAFALQVRPDSTTEIIVTMTPIIASLDEVRVDANGNARDPGLERTGFYDRQRRSAASEFLTPEQVALHNGADLDILVQGQPSLLISHRPHGGARIYSARGARNCLMNVFVDGQHIAPGSDVPLGGPDIKAVEIYPSAIETPAEFQVLGPGSRCGTLVVWSRAR